MTSIFRALSADLASGEGFFHMPKALVAQKPLAKLDILSDWVEKIEDERNKAFGECFVDMVLIPHPEAAFDKSFSVFEGVIKELRMNIPESIREICEEAYIEMCIKKKS